jgi:hypothetical protein
MFALMAAKQSVIDEDNVRWHIDELGCLKGESLQAPLCVKHVNHELKKWGMWRTIFGALWTWGRRTGPSFKMPPGLFYPSYLADGCRSSAKATRSEPILRVWSVFRRTWPSGEATDSRDAVSTVSDAGTTDHACGGKSSVNQV